MRVVFYGTPEFAVPTLDALVAAGHAVVLVVAQPDKPAGRGNQVHPPPVAARAVALGLPLAQPKAVRSGPFPERVLALGADVAVVVAYGRILPPALLDAPRFGCVNVHASLLPRWRGAAPIQAAIRAGDAVTGVCTQRMEEGLDTGPVYLARETPIGPRETAGQLHDRLSLLAATIAVDTLALLPATPTPQATDGITWAPKIERDDGAITFDLAATEIDRRIRAYTPWPGGFVELPSGRLKLLEVLPVAAAPGALRGGAPPGATPPGHLRSIDPLVVATADGDLQLVTVQAPGRRPVTGADYANGARLRPGAPLRGAD
ncbi:MAG: methionyl-tRNA formyltransferase [Myxococcota bacterium]